MSTQSNGRGRRWQVARNLTIAVATAALAGGGAAMAADGGSAPSTSKPAPAGAAMPTAKAPANADRSAPAKPGERAPLTTNEPVVTDARTRLDGLVADGTIRQAEADAVMRDVLAGSVDPGALVRSGEVSAAHMPAINNELVEVKRANQPGA
jgi:hypothetical protein